MHIVRLLNRKDRPALTQIYNETVLEGFPEYSRKTREFFITPKYRADMFSLPTQLGIFKDKQLVGYILAWGPHGGVTYIYWLAILKKYRKLGLGTELLNNFETWCKKKGVHVIQMQTDKRNVSFYEKKGYEVFAFDKKSYFGVDNYLMRKFIQKPLEKNFLKI